ncbi:Gamma-tubulin complex component 6, partial [Orchesella cincta]
ASISQYEALRVTPLHEDEGYLSPSEEDLKNSFPNRPGGFLNCKTRSSHRSESCQSRASGTAEESIEWDVIAKIPYIRHEHFSWDRLKLPVPYRFYDEHKLCLRQIRQSPIVSYVTDSTSKLPDVIENIWRSYGPATEEQDKQPSYQTVAPLHAIQSRKEEPVHISVKQFIQHIFHLVCGRESQSFSIVAGDRFTFSKNPLVLVHGLSPSVVHNLSTEYLNAGKVFKRLSHLSALHYDEKLMEREGLSCNAVFITFLKFISDYLKLYQISLMLKASEIHTFSSLVIFFEPFRYQLQALDKILELYITTDQITLLKGLNMMMLCCETPFLADLLRSLFITCSAAYLRYVSDWVFRGTLTRGFHIQRKKLSTYQDRRYWVKQFSQVTDVPFFLEDALSLIFETGKAINLLNLIRNKG